MSESLLFTSTVNFEAARNVTLLPEGHRSRRLHGHSFLTQVRSTLPDSWATFHGSELLDLTALLRNTLQPLDYRFLNEVIDQPTDENLARWIRNQLDLDGLDAIGIQSTRHEGVDLDSQDHAHIWRRYAFQSAHQLPNVPIGHKCGRMHGHGFEVILHANQDLSSREMGIDYDKIDSLCEPINLELDYACLNDIPGLENPTSEIICSWIWERLKPKLPELSWVTVYETSQCGAHFDGKNYRIWKEFTFDSALKLVNAPANSNLRRIHGHTYLLRLHMSAPLNSVMGWTVDFGDVKEKFAPIFKRLDHNPLYEIQELTNSHPATIARWIRRQAETDLPELDRIDLYETPGCGVIINWGQDGPALPI